MSDSDSAFDAMLREAAELRVPADTRELPELGAHLQDKYRIEEQLGAGGMGAVFRATNLENGKQVAIKWLLGRSSKACARFSREAQLAAQIDHPNVVNVFDLGTHRGGPFIVMELLRGQSLGKRLRDGRISGQELVAIMLPVLRGLRAAHAANVIHRDLKPDNVFLCLASDGSAREPKVLDFGVSKLRCEPAPEERLTNEGAGVGTVAYMSPEQLDDAANVDVRTDIYAAGVMMYEALTGRLPFRAQSQHGMVLAIAAQRPIPIRTLVPDVDRELERIVLRAMAKEPGQRHGDAQALIDDLGRWAARAEGSTEEERERAGAAARGVSSSVTARGPTARGRRWQLRALLLAAAVLLWYAAARAPSAPTRTARATLVPSPSSLAITPPLAPTTMEARLPEPPLVPAAPAQAEPAAPASRHPMESLREVSALPSAARHGVVPHLRAPSPAGPLKRSDLL